MKREIISALLLSVAISTTAVHSGVIVSKDRRWPSKEIPYLLDQSSIPFELFKRIDVAISLWNNRSPVALRAKTATDDAYLIFTYEPDFPMSADADADIGYTGRIIHSIRFKVRDPSFSLILHEIGHIAGLLHEHSHCLRDRYINVRRDFPFPDEASREAMEEFLCIPLLSSYGATSLPDPYDFSSIMHYPFRNAEGFNPYFLTEEGQRYLESRFPEVSLGNIGLGGRLSDGDVLSLKRLYELQ